MSTIGTVINQIILDEWAGTEFSATRPASASLPIDADAFGELMEHVRQVRSIKALDEPDQGNPLCGTY